MKALKRDLGGDEVLCAEPDQQSEALVDEIVKFARFAKPLLEFGWFALGKADGADE
jgi:hypothetical protein